MRSSSIMVTDKLTHILQSHNLTLFAISHSCKSRKHKIFFSDFTMFKDEKNAKLVSFTPIPDSKGSYRGSIAFPEVGEYVAMTQYNDYNVQVLWKNWVCWPWVEFCPLLLTFLTQPYSHWPLPPERILSHSWSHSLPSFSFPQAWPAIIKVTSWKFWWWRQCYQWRKLLLPKRWLRLPTPTPTLRLTKARMGI